MLVIPNPKTTRRVNAAAKRGIIEGMPSIEWSAIGDTYGYTPHVTISLKHADHLHHNTLRAIAGRVARTIWGEHASVVRIGYDMFGNPRYEAVWCASDTPLPSFMDARYGSYRVSGLAVI